MAAILLACVVGRGVAARGQGVVTAWTSSADGTRKLERLPDIHPAIGVADPKAERIAIDPAQRFQTVVGYGAAMTDASAQLLQHRLSRSARDGLFAELFGRSGLGLSFVRVPIGASDFSTEHYSLDDMPAGSSDSALAHFSMAKPAIEQIPALQAIRRINHNLVLMASPWSAPAWMKTGGSLIKGQLRPDAYPAYAQYFGRYLRGMASVGLPVRYVSVQNEPDFEPANYPGMKFTAADRAAFVGDHLGPLLARERNWAKILEWDHNWDQPQQPLAVLGNAKAARYVTGVAWHCYAGEPEVMDQVRVAHPDKDVFFTECSGGAWAPDWGGTLEWMTDHLVIAPSRYGSRGTILWNLALDEHAGTHLGGCGDCRGVVTIDSKSGAITRNVEYYVLGQVSHFVARDARRISSTTGQNVANVAFRNPDGSYVLLAHNHAKMPQPLFVHTARTSFSAVMPAGEVTTFVWHEPMGRHR